MLDFQVYQYFYLFFISVLTFVAIGQYKVRTIPDFNDYYHRKSNWGYAYGVILTIALSLIIGLRAEDGQFSDSLNYRFQYYNHLEGYYFQFDKDAENFIFDNLFAWWGSLRLGLSNFFLLMDILYFGFMFTACKRLFPKDTYIALLCYLAAFSTFSYSFNGIKAGVAASIFLLAISYYKRWIICIPLILVSWGFHHSMILPICAFIISLFYKNPKPFFFVWCICIVLSVLNISYFQELFANLAEESGDTRGAMYLSSDSDVGWEGKAGFRLDFLIYSAMPIVVGYIAIFKKKIKTNSIYNLLLKLYITTNSVWLLCMHVQFNNRIAYLSWFLYPIVLIYPFLNLDWSQYQLKYFSKVILLHLGFTLFMYLIYYGGLRLLLGI